MYKHINTLRSWRGYSIVLVLSCMVALSITGWSFGVKSYSQDNSLLVKNQTGAFQLVNVERDKEFFRVSLKNVSNKAINGYSISLNDGIVMDTDYTISEHVIASGEIEQIQIPVAPQPASASQQRSIEIQAVVFEDNTQEGDFRSANNITQRRLGLKMQLARIMPLLHDALNSSDAALPQALDKLESQLISLSEQQEIGQPLSVKHGLHDAKDEMLSLIRSLKQKQLAQGNINLREELLNLKTQNEKRRAKL